MDQLTQEAFDKLQLQLDAATESNKTYQLLVEEQSNKLEELQLLLDAKNETAVLKELPFVEHEGKLYQFTKERIILSGDSTKYIATEAATDPAIVAKILALNGQTILVEVAEQ